MLSLFTFSFILAACVYDPPTPYIEIENHSGDTITFELYFDNENYKAYWSRSDFETFLEYPYGSAYPGAETRLVSTDRARLVQRYEMPNGSVFIIHDGWGDRNESVLYAKLKVYKNGDTLSFNNIEEMKRSFKRVDMYCSNLSIN